MGLKFDHPPLLAPGRHRMTLADIEALCVAPFDGAARSCRERLFYGLEQVIQALLNAKIPCDIFSDGSFFTEKPEPGDVDVIISIESSVFDALNEDQLQVVEAMNNGYVAEVDSIAITSYPHGHPHRGFALDCENLIEGYGLEHAQVWLKGFAVIRLWETDVGNRICS